jgi:thioredoxin reductase
VPAVFDVLVVGGGPAGLSAALMLGRCRRSVLLCDLGEPRNRCSHGVHGFLTRDGIRPDALTALGRAEVASYGVTIRQIGVVDAVWCDNQFRVTFSDGADERCRFLLIATGVVDDLPALSGLRECYGQSVFHCPYCDGWEQRDRRLAVLGVGKDASGMALALTTWSRDVALCTNGGRIDPPARGRLERNGVAVRSEPIERIEHADGLMRTILFARGEPLDRDALFFTSGQHPQSDLAVRLGCTLNRRGTVKTGTLSNTNVPNVFVAGDASRDAQFVVVAAAEGVKAAVAINQALQQQELVP